MTCQQRYPGCTLCGCDPVGGLYECTTNEGDLAGHYWQPSQFKGTTVNKNNTDASYEMRHYGSITFDETPTCELPDCAEYVVLSDGRFSCNKC